MPPTYSQLSEEVETKVRKHLQEIVDQLALEDLRAEVVISSGRRSTEIVRVAERQGCDLIAMATHGRNVLARGILGSVTDEVVHASRVPVLTMTPEKAEIYRLHKITMAKIMVLLDGSPLAETVLPYVEDLARKLSLEILLVRVVKPLHMFWMDHYPTSLDEQEKAVEVEATNYLETTAEKLKAAGLSAQSQLLTGHPATSIIELARETPHDIIALATHGHSGVMRWAMGSVAEALVRGTGDPVLIVPPPDSRQEM